MAVVFIIDGIIAVIITITVAAAGVVAVITVVTPAVAVVFAANAATLAIAVAIAATAVTVGNPQGQPQAKSSVGDYWCHQGMRHIKIFIKMRRA
jgi:hypothetical protein